jgi:DNA-binding GntR family transcriptional regulator
MPKKTPTAMLSRVDTVSQPPSGRRPLVELGVEAIRTSILQAEYAPGQRLVEAELMKRLRLGRGPVREALRRLSVEGLVAIEPNRGALVARADRPTIDGTFELREVLEGLAARRAAERIDSSGFRNALAEALKQERASSPERDAQTFMEMNERLHGLIVAASGNAVTPRILAQLQLPEVRAVFFRNHSPAAWRQSTADHVAIIEAILSGKADAAETAMREHVRRTAQLGTKLPGVVP